ncbi:MAG: chitobiase/beta-hexosaminidase C-terminal domain-containing protein, partial [Planctomycetota bacterium]
LANSIFSHNVAPMGSQLAVWGGGAILDVSYCDVIGGPAGVYNDGATLNWNTGNQNVDPAFAALGSWDDNGTPTNYLDDEWIGGDCHLKSEVGRWDPTAGGGAGGWVTDSLFSPVIDQGNPASVYSNEPTPNGARINMGAYGNTPYASKSPVFLTMVLAGSGTGTLTPAPGVHPVAAGNTYGIQAVADAMCEFIDWSAAPGGNALIGSPTSPSTTVTVYDSVTITATIWLKVETPQFSPAPGSYPSPQSVSISCATSGAQIRYTTNGSTPTGGSPLYTGPISVTSSKTLKAIALKSGMADSDIATGAYIIDMVGPVVSGLSTLPTVVREGIDTTLTVMATANDTATGGSNIAGAECFVGADPGQGAGIPMSASDGSFNSPVEGVTGTINTSFWTQGTYQVRVRARDRPAPLQTSSPRRLRVWKKCPLP